MYKLILASQSPRRKQLLTEAGFSYLELPSQVSETPSENLNPQGQIIEIAERKARACLLQNKHLKSQDYIVLSADTEVVIDGRLLGKPDSVKVAMEFLRLLSGRVHQVITGICLLNCRTLEHVTAATITEIHFKELTAQQISDYVNTGEPFDKAGGYGIQGAAQKFVDKIIGPFDNVVGLPVETVKVKLKEKNWVINVGK